MLAEIVYAVIPAAAGIGAGWSWRGLYEQRRRSRPQTLEQIVYGMSDSEARVWINAMRDDDERRREVDGGA